MKYFLLFACCFPFLIFAQEMPVSGKITGNDGKPVAGATVQVKQTGKSVLADEDGMYRITAVSGNDLIVTGVNFETKQIHVGSSGTIDVMMNRSLIELVPVAVVGSRSLKRSATETPAPVDVIPISRVMNQQAQVDINQILQYVAPSFNSNKQSGADGADHVDPATLRGLGPDQTLVLVNGKRRHQSALVNLYGTRGRGNTGTDLNTIPAAAIERIEILRDGASAQYGSDAIAGVINIILKNNVKQFTANVTGGTAITGYGSSLKSPKGKIIPHTSDGEQLNANINYGFALANKGFINVTGDIFRKEKTHRPNYTPLFPDNFRKEFGDMSATNASIYFNSVIPLKGVTEFYWFGGLNYRKGDAAAYTRDPESERNVLAIYPNGFDPHIQSSITDPSISAGIRAKWGEWSADFNVTYGSNKFKYEVDHSLNASMEASSPTHFNAGGFKLSQYLAGTDFTRSFENVGQGLNLALGAEFRHEQYSIFAGELNSYKTYGPIQFITSNGDTVYRPGGSQGFPGFQPADEAKKGRNNLGVYADAELDVLKDLLIAGAIRMENYSDFGITSNYKLATRFKLFKNVFFRSSVSTGFRAPSLPQINFSSTYTDVVAGKIIDKKIAPNYSNIAKQVGIPELKQETSVNYSAGITARSGNFSLTLDGYSVAIKDRIVLTGAFDTGDDKIGTILQSLNVGAAQFFTNAIDTRTQGFDVIATWSHKWGKSSFNTTLAGNFNKMKITGIKTSALLKGKENIYFGDREKAFLVASAPPHKINFSVEYDISRFSAFARLIHFAAVNLVNYGNDIDHYQGKFVTDLSIGYKITDKVNVTVGGTNILDIYPTYQDPGLTESAGMWDAVQMGFTGAFYFARVSVRL